MENARTGLFTQGRKKAKGGSAQWDEVLVGFVELGDFKPLVFRHEDGDMVKVIVGKDGHYLVITVNLLDDTWASREVRR